MKVMSHKNKYKTSSSFRIYMYSICSIVSYFISAPHMILCAKKGALLLSS